MELLVDKLLKALGLGVDKAKKKVDELMIIHQEAMKLADFNVTPKQEQNATPLVKPQAPKAQPVYQYIPPIKGNNNTGGKALTVNFGGVTVKDKVDADMLMNQVTWHAKSVGL
jgi:hypothetical protein